MSIDVATEHELLVSPCRDADELDAWIRFYTRLAIPRVPVCAHHVAPFEYIQRAYFEPAQDLIVWAPRGGGKTRLAALATLLDLLHKPGCSVRILGGSLEQSLRMWEHLFPDLQRMATDLLDSRAKSSRRAAMTNGSSCAVLTQSQRAVRGLRVQKLRCDEVEMFDPEIWEAAQLVTKSSGFARGVGAPPTLDVNDFVGEAPAPRLGNDHHAAGTPGIAGAIEEPTPRLGNDGRPQFRPRIAGAVEAISTFHNPWGLMSRIIDAAPARNTPVLRWCILDVLERCPAQRECAACPLWDECKGVAKIKCDGFVSIDDAIAMKRRVSKQTWESEMLCIRPSVQGSVFPGFDPSVHVREEIAALPEAGRVEIGAEVSLALDFGFAAPFVCLWIRNFENGVTHVIDEYVQRGVAVDQHIEHIRARPYGTVTRVACDPAGAGRNDQTAMSNVTLLRQAGFVVRFRRSLIVEGLEMIRTALNPAAGDAQLFIHPRCRGLIKSMQAYHYPPGGGEVPLKDGENDHLIDALRYHYVNRPAEEAGEGRRY